MLFLKVSISNIFIFLICLYGLALQVSSQNTSKPGDRLKSSSQLVSAYGVFILGYYTPGDTNNSYLAILYRDFQTHPVWIGNREHPASKNSDPGLSIDSSGKLVITHGEGEPDRDTSWRVKQECNGHFVG